MLATAAGVLSLEINIGVSIAYYRSERAYDALEIVSCSNVNDPQ